LVIGNADAADLIYMDNKNEKNSIAENVEMACRFYGINFLPVNMDEVTPSFILKKSNEGRFIGGVVINARAFPIKRFDSLRSAFRVLGQKNNAPVPILITGFEQGTDVGLVRFWSGGIIQSVVQEEFSAGANYRIVNVKDLTFELSDQTFQIERSGRFTREVFRTASDMKSSHFIDVIKIVGTNGVSHPVFIKSLLDDIQIFLHTGNSQNPKQALANSDVFDGERFIDIAPILLFLRHTFKDKCWHPPSYLANLTIDDPWLIEPYGNLSYTALLAEMEKYNFHTTIAFIPWNYDRNNADVINLFNKHPDRFSLAFHGNNHDHKEFSGKSLAQEEDLILQALARMEILSRNSGLSYDRVMIFPHNIGSAKTLSLLKKYNFLATINSTKVPRGLADPSDYFERAKAVTLKYENFPSVQRNGLGDPPTISPSWVAKELFLNGFVLFSGHQDLFKDGIGAFSQNASMVNHIRPDIRWASLGAIARHLYFERIRDDGDTDVIAYSSEILLENRRKKIAVYHVRKEESFEPPIREVLVNGKPYRSEIEGNSIVLTIELMAGASKKIQVIYENDYNMRKVDISKRSLRVYLLRKFSDFRDLVLSRNVIGMFFVKYYYKTNFFHYGMVGLFAIVLVILLVSVLAILLLRNRMKKSG
jgi:hypothetical protein